MFVYFVGCKKYPENNLWFKSSAKTIKGEWSLVFFEINGNDSLNDNVKLISEKMIKFTLNDDNKLFVKHTDGEIKVNGAGGFGGFWNISKSKKEIEIIFNYNLENYTNLNTCICYNFQNIFAAYGQKIKWKIEKLCKEDFWITTNYNNLKYELHFKK